jgi:hypothetical protein
MLRLFPLGQQPLDFGRNSASRARTSAQWGDRFDLLFIAEPAPGPSQIKCSAARLVELLSRPQSQIVFGKTNPIFSEQAYNHFHSIKSLFSSPNITPPQLLPTYSY